MKNPTAILFGPFVGELYWECGRFAPILLYMASLPKYKETKFIVLTRSDRFDLYGTYADILVPLIIPDDYNNKTQPDCFRLCNMKKGLYENIAKLFKTKYEKEYKIIRHIYPNINGKIFANKNQFSKEKMNYIFSPRKLNYELIEEYIVSKKPTVVLAPRYRKNYKRNWPNWEEFYDILYNDEFLMNKFQFVICGKKDEYIPDSKDRFLDINKIHNKTGSSLIGLLIALLQKSILTVGSQSAIPNISLLCKTEVLEFGHQKHLHTKTYNHYNTPITFLNNSKYDINPKKFFNHMKQILKKMENK